MVGAIKIIQQVVSEGTTFCVESLSDLTEKIIPFFDKYSVEGVKALDFFRFQASIWYN